MRAFRKSVTTFRQKWLCRCGLHAFRRHLGQRQGRVGFGNPVRAHQRVIMIQIQMPIRQCRVLYGFPIHSRSTGGKGLFTMRTTKTAGADPYRVKRVAQQTAMPMQQAAVFPITAAISQTVHQLPHDRVYTKIFRLYIRVFIHYGSQVSSE